MRVRVVAWALVCSLSTSGGVAEAQGETSAGDRAVALGQSGIELYRTGQYAAAFVAFESADAAVHSPVFVLYMARCKAASGELLAARALYARVATEELGAGAPEPWVAARREADLEGQRLARTIPTVRIQAFASTAVEVAIDGRVLSAEELAGPVPLDPGVHPIVATSGTQRREVEIRLAAGDPERVVSLDLRPPPPPVHPGDDGPWLVVGGVAIGVGASGLLAGAITGGVAMAKTSEIEERCLGSSCLVSDADDAAVAEDFATASTVAFVAGGVVAGAGVAFVVVPAVTGAPTSAAPLRVDVGARGLAVRAAF